MTTDNISILHYYKVFTQFWSTCFEEIDINSIPYISLKCYAKDTAIQLMCLLLLLIWVGTTAFKSVYFQSNNRHPYTISITQGVTHVFRADHHNCLGNWNGQSSFIRLSKRVSKAFISHITKTSVLEKPVKPDTNLAVGYHNLTVEDHSSCHS